MKNERILIAHADKAFRERMKNFLTLRNYSCNTAKNGIECLAILKCNKFDYIISGLNMPLMDGPEMAEYIKKDKKISNTKIIMLMPEKSASKNASIKIDHKVTEHTNDFKTLTDIYEKLRQDKK